MEFNMRYHSTADTCIVCSTHRLLYLPSLNSEWKVGLQQQKTSCTCPLVSPRGLSCLPSLGLSSELRGSDWEEVKEAEIAPPHCQLQLGPDYPRPPNLLDLSPRFVGFAALHCCLHPRLCRIKRVVAEKNENEFHIIKAESRPQASSLINVWHCIKADDQDMQLHPL